MTLPYFTIDLIDDEAGFRALAPDWDALHARSRGLEPYARHDWIALCWARHKKERGTRPHIVTVRLDGRLVAVLPLRAGAGLFGLKLLRWIDSKTPFYCDVLREDSADGVAALMGAAAYLRRDRRVLRFKLENVPDDADALPLFDVLGGGAGNVNLIGTLDLARFDDEEALIKGQPPKMRRDYRSTLRDLRKLGEVETLRLTDREEVTQAVAWLFVTKADRLRQDRKLYSWFVDPETAQLFISAALGGLTSNACRVYALKLDRRTIAVELVFCAADTCYLSKEAFDPNFPRMSIGTVIRLHAMMKMQAEGFKTVDFMLGEYPWKERMRTGTRKAATYRAPGPLLRHLGQTRVADESSRSGGG